jgi:hypothetical protein
MHALTAAQREQLKSHGHVALAGLEVAPLLHQPQQAPAGPRGQYAIYVERCTIRRVCVQADRVSL